MGWGINVLFTCENKISKCYISTASAAQQILYGPNSWWAFLKQKKKQIEVLENNKGNITKCQNNITLTETCETQKKRLELCIHLSGNKPDGIQ